MTYPHIAGGAVLAALVPAVVLIARAPCAWGDVPGKCVVGCSSASPPERPRGTSREREERTPPGPYHPTGPDPSWARRHVKEVARAQREALKNLVRLETPVKAEMQIVRNDFVGGAALFGLGRQEGQTFFAPSARTPADRIPIENLRRSMAILKAAVSRIAELQDEDIGFLGAQASLAMEGAPLEVVVMGQQSRKGDKSALRLGELANEVAAAEDRLAEAVSKRLEIERRLVAATTPQGGQAAEEPPTGGSQTETEGQNARGSSPYRDYEAAAAREEQATRELEEAQKAVIIIVTD